MSAVVSMNEETRRMEQFNDIVSNIKPLMTVGKGKIRWQLQVAQWFRYLVVLWIQDIRA